MFLALVTVAFSMGGLFALLLRVQAVLVPAPRDDGPLTYNRLFTLHGVVMVWLFMIPAIPSAFGNFLIR
jgi:cytochrome c oxidase subunit 1